MNANLRRKQTEKKDTGAAQTKRNSGKKQTVYKESDKENIPVRFKGIALIRKVDEQAGDDDDELKVSAFALCPRSI